MVQLNTIEKSDILSRDEYKSKRKSLREKMVLRKKFRRVDIGPYVTMYFENKDTIIHQINEMVYIENGGEGAPLAPILTDGVYTAASPLFASRISSAASCLSSAKAGDTCANEPNVAAAATPPAGRARRCA